MVPRPACTSPFGASLPRRRLPAKALALALVLLLALAPMAGCGRLAASATYNPLVRVETADGEWVYFMVRPERRTYFGKNVFDHRLARTDDFTMVEGIGNPAHRVWAQIIGTVEAICFIPAFLVVQLENFTGIAFVLPLGQWVAHATNWILFPFDWAAHDVPVAAAGFLWPFGSPEDDLRPVGSKPLVVAKARYPASPSNFVFFLWPWFQPGYANLKRTDATPQVRDTEVEYAPGLAPAPAAVTDPGPAAPGKPDPRAVTNPGPASAKPRTGPAPPVRPPK